MTESDSPKLRLYRGLLMWAFPLLRNRLQVRWQSKKMHRDTMEIAELLHFVPPLIGTGGFDAGDEYFLRAGASSFLQNYSDKSCAEYVTMADHLEEIYGHVCNEVEVQWEFPASVRELVVRHREAQMEHRRRMSAQKASVSSEE